MKREVEVWSLRAFSDCQFAEGDCRSQRRLSRQLEQQDPQGDKQQPDEVFVEPPLRRLRIEQLVSKSLLVDLATHGSVQQPALRLIIAKLRQHTNIFEG